MFRSRFQIHVRDFVCRAFHGVYAGERTSGQDFRVGMTVTFSEGGPVAGMADTVSYTDLIAVIREVMAETEELLETVAQKMSDRVFREHPSVEEVEVRIDKIAAPIPNFGGTVGISYSRKKQQG